MLYDYQYAVNNAGEGSTEVLGSKSLTGQGGKKMASGRNNIINAVLAEKAAEHIKEMDIGFAGETERSARESIIYGGPDKTPSPLPAVKCDQVFRDIDSVAAAIAYRKKGKVAILNFADYVKPGGLFLRGSRAQEESLCMESNLFNILNQEALSGYYEYNKKNRNRELYTDRAIYTPGVIFVRDGEQYQFDVITCAAPNKSSAGRYHRVTTEENHEIMQERIRFLRAIAEDQKVEILIAGAWGCGVFGQPPTLVAKWFDRTFYRSGISKIVYAVPSFGKDNANVRAFKKMFY